MKKLLFTLIALLGISAVDAYAHGYGFYNTTGKDVHLWVGYSGRSGTGINFVLRPNESKTVSSPDYGLAYITNIDAAPVGNPVGTSWRGSRIGNAWFYIVDRENGTIAIEQENSSKFNPEKIRIIQ